MLLVTGFISSTCTMPPTLSLFQIGIFSPYPWNSSYQCTREYIWEFLSPPSMGYCLSSLVHGDTYDAGFDSGPNPQNSCQGHFPKGICSGSLQDRLLQNKLIQYIAGSEMHSAVCNSLHGRKEHSGGDPCCEHSGFVTTKGSPFSSVKCWRICLCF